jgi:Protein of unknown function (DUF2637)
MTRRLTWKDVAFAAVTVVALLGAVFSYSGQFSRAEPIFGRPIAYAFPVMVDGLIAACAAYYIGTVAKGRPQLGYRWVAHAGIAATIVLNALAARSPAEVPWHVVAPAIWGVLIELRAREVLGDYRAEHGSPTDRLPWRLWVAEPVASARVAVWMARTGTRSHVEARAQRGEYLAAKSALQLNAKRRRRRLRRLALALVRSGTLDPAVLVQATGLDGTLEPGSEAIAKRARQVVLAAALQRRSEAGQDRARGGPALVSGAGLVPAPRPASKAIPRASGKVTRGRLSDAQLAARTAALLEQEPDLSARALAVALRIGRDRAGPLLAAVRNGHGGGQ